jgi:hypothetical protein
MSPLITVLHAVPPCAYLVRMPIKKSGASRVLKWPLLLAGIILCATTTPLIAYDINDRLVIGGVAAGAWQCQELSEGAGSADACRGALPFRPHLDYRPTASDRLYTEFAFAAGNGLNEVSPFRISPWAADLEDDVKNLNNNGRNYLVTAWYRHTFRFSTENTVAATVGIIDSTDYLDNNIYANDEYTQFLNEAFVNSPQISLPSYAPGAALQWDVDRWSLRAVYMNVGNEEDETSGDSYNYIGLEAGYSLQTSLGNGNYRAFFTSTSSDFPDPSGSRAERRTVAGISFDQELADGLGAFIRVISQSDKPAVSYDALYLGGLDIRGSRWGRKNDNLGLGIGYLHGGNLDIDSTHLAETYYRFVINEHFALTADLQYMRDDVRIDQGPEGFIIGLRADAHF